MTSQLKPTIVDGALDAAGLAVVHSSNHKPVINPDGSVDLPSTYVATGGREARSTVHFTLNHKVSSHLYGSWDDTDYAIIAPFSGVVEQEGPPAMIVPTDTFWTTNARDPLRLPDATVVMPAETGADELVSFGGRHVSYKTRNFTAADEEILASGQGVMQEKLREAAGTPQRDALLKQLSMEHAVNQTLTRRGYAVEPGNQWGWVRPDYNYRMTDKLADALGTRGSIPHMRTGYHSLSESMNKLLTLADCYEAKAGNGNILKYDDNYVLVCDSSGKQIGALDRMVVSIYDEKGVLQDSLGRLGETAAGLDARTQDVVRDFSAKIAARIETAKAAIVNATGGIKTPVDASGQFNAAPGGGTPAPAHAGPQTKTPALSFEI